MSIITIGGLKFPIKTKAEKKKCSQSSLTSIQPLLLPYLLPLRISSLFFHGTLAWISLACCPLFQNTIVTGPTESKHCQSDPPAGPKGLCDKLLVLLATVTVPFQRQE